MSDVRRPAVVLDMTGVRPGGRTFPIGDGNVRVPRGVRVVRSVPAQVRFDFELRTFRTVPVRVRFASDRQAAEVESYVVTPPQLRVLGPESHVGRISAATTDPIDLSGVSDHAEMRISAFVEDAYVRFQSPPTVLVSVTMKKK
jgi:YbbR domain-containing protein